MTSIVRVLTMTIAHACQKLLVIVLAMAITCACTTEGGIFEAARRASDLAIEQPIDRSIDL